MGIIQQNLVNPCSITHTRTVTSNTTNLNAQTLFGADYTADSCKNLIINNGVSIGGTDLFLPALDVPSGMNGSMKIINNGSILGAGGKGGQWTQGSGYNDSACTTRGGGRLLLCTNTSYENEDGTNDDSNLVYGRPGAFLFDLNGNFIKRLNVPINNPSQRSGAYATRIAIGGDRMFVAVNQSYNASQTYWPSEGFHIYDLNGNLLSNGTAIRHGNATSEWCSSIAANDNYVVIGDRGMGSGTFGGYYIPGVYVYNHSGTHIANWRGTDTGANGYDGFGWSVDINAADDIVVGASMKNAAGSSGTPYEGAVYYFPNLSNSGQVKMNGPATPQNSTSGSYPNHNNPNPHFGRQVKIGKTTIMTSAPFCKHFSDVNPSSGYSTSELGEVSFWNFSGQLLANKTPKFTHDPTNKNDGYRFGSYGIIKPTPEPSTGDEYWLAATSSETGWQAYWQNQQYIAMFDSSFNQVGTFASRNSYSVTCGGTFESDSGMCMTPAGADYPRVIIAGGSVRVNQSKGSIMIFEHDKFRSAPNAVPMPRSSGGSYVEVWDIGSPDTYGTVNQAGILTGGNYLKWHYIMRGEDGGDAIRCNSANVGINNQGTIYGGGGGGGSGCKQYVSGSYDEGKGGIGGNGQGYNQSQTNAPSSSIQQGGNGGTYGNDGVRGTGDGIGIPTSYGDRIRNQSWEGFKYNHRKYNFKRSPILSHDGGQSGFIVTSTNNNSVEFFNNGTRGGRL